MKVRNCGKKSMEKSGSMDGKGGRTKQTEREMNKK